MIELPYSLVIEATPDPSYFSFYSPELEGFTGSGCTIEDCLDKAREGMQEHVELLQEHRLPVPLANSNPVVTIRNDEPVANTARDGR